MLGTRLGGVATAPAAAPVTLEKYGNCKCVNVIELIRCVLAPVACMEFGTM